MGKNQRTILRLCMSLLFFGAAREALAMSVDWAGTYRIEYTEVDHTSLGDPTLRKSYLLNSLQLSPKIIASDAVNIVAKFEVLPNSYYPGSSIGQTFGLGTATSATPSTAEDSNVAAQRQGTSNMQVSQLYLSVNQEYGAFVAGRAPIHFGLGMTHNAGTGAFDHWYDTRDLVGYKFIIGNLSFMPILGRVYDYSMSQGKDVQDMIWNIEYNNPETESIFGLWYQTRTATQQANDAPATIYGGTAVSGGWNVQDTNFFLARGFESVKFKLEAGFRSGSTGITTAAGEDVKLNGYGVALEMDFPAKEGKTSWLMRLGLASGDNPETANYEGFQFDRNYDLGFLLYNHPMGKVDIAKSAVSRTPDKRSCAANCAAGPTDEVADEDSVGNTIYLSPKIRYQMADKWDLTTTFTYAQLQNARYRVGATYEEIGKDVGYELDIGTVFRPTEKIQWVNEVGFLFPGSAYKGGSANYSNGFTFGFQSKAAISF